jgi:tungstate transport system substrate-binding protein
MRRRAAAGLAFLIALALLQGPAAAEEKFITVASTTSTEQSGLFGHLLPLFTGRTGIEVRVVAQGTGQALQTGARGDADVVLVHDPQLEKKFVQQGNGVQRHAVMYNDFVLVGPAADPAGVRGMTDAAAALGKIAARKAIFASRGDDSGTHQAELRLWRSAGLEPQGRSWYRETGSGMGPTLNTAAGLGAYALTDRATWLAFSNKQDLEILVEGDRRLFNQYGAILVNPKKHPHVKAQWGQAFIDWLTSPEGQQAIADHKVGGRQLFFPNAGDPDA